MTLQQERKVEPHQQQQQMFFKQKLFISICVCALGALGNALSEKFGHYSIIDSCLLEFWIFLKGFPM